MLPTVCRPRMLLIVVSSCEGLANRKAIDELISSHAIDWTLDRANVDRNILRIAVFEHLPAPCPCWVAINEAGAGQVYGDEESSKFVNRVLGAIARSEVGESTDGPAERKI